MIVEKIISRLNKDHLNEDFFCELLDAVNRKLSENSVGNILISLDVSHNSAEGFKVNSIGNLFENEMIDCVQQSLESLDDDVILQDFDEIDGKKTSELTEEEKKTYAEDEKIELSLQLELHQEILYGQHLDNKYINYRDYVGPNKESGISYGFSIDNALERKDVFNVVLASYYIDDKDKDVEEKIFKTIDYLKDDKSILLYVALPSKIKKITKILQTYEKRNAHTKVLGENYYIDAIFGLKGKTDNYEQTTQEPVILLIRKESESFKFINEQTWVATLSKKNIKYQIDNYFQQHIEIQDAYNSSDNMHLYGVEFDNDSLQKDEKIYYSQWSEEREGDFEYLERYKGHKSWVALMKVKSLAIEYDEYKTYLFPDLIKKVEEIKDRETWHWDDEKNESCYKIKEYEDENNCIYINRFTLKSFNLYLFANDIPNAHANYYQVVLDEKILPKYLQYFFMSELGQLNLKAHFSTQVMPNKSLKNLSNMYIPVPDIERQRKIIKINEEIEKTEKQIAVIKKNIAWQPKTETLYAESIEKITGIIKEVTQDDIYYDIINNGETKNIEFKSTFSMNLKNISQNKDKDVEKGSIKTLAGYLNTDGGELFIGISDDGQILGLEQEIEHFYKKKGLDGLKLHFMNQLNNLLGKSVVAAHIDINLHTFKEENKTILIAKCNKSEEGVFFDKSDFYIRQDPQTQKLEGKEMLDYIEQRKKSFNK